MKNADRISAGVIIGISAYFLIETRSFEKFGSFFPVVIAFVLAGFAAALFVASFIRKSEEEKKEKIKLSSVLLIILIIVAWAFFITVIGFLVTCILFFLLVTIAYDRRRRDLRHILIKVGAVGTTVTAFYFFFAKFLLVPFPRGLLF